MMERDLGWLKCRNQLYRKYLDAYIKDNGDNSGAMNIQEFEEDIKKRVLEEFVNECRG